MAVRFSRSGTFAKPRYPQRLARTDWAPVNGVIANSFRQSITLRTGYFKMQAERKILFLTEYIHNPPQSGGEIRDAEVLAALLEIGVVDAVVFRSLTAKEGKIYHGIQSCNTVQYIDMALSHPRGLWKALYRSSIGRLAQLVLSPFPYCYSGLCPNPIKKALKNQIRNKKYDLIWLQNTRLAFCCRLFDRRRTVLDGDDYDSVRFYHLLKNSSWYWAKIFNYLDLMKLYLWELLLPSLFHTVVRCSMQDKIRINRSNVIVIPNGTNIPALSNEELREKDRFLFIGLLDYEPNRHGVEWFISDIWAMIRQKLPGAKIDVIGKNPSSIILRQNGVNGVSVHGFVDDLTPFLARASCSVVPLLAGGGTRLKVLESLAFATPVVSTSIGSYGIDIFSDAGLYREDSAISFANRCVWIANNQDAVRSQANRGRCLVRDLYNWDRLRRKVKTHATSIWSPHDTGI